MNDLMEKVNQARLEIFIKDPFFGYVLQHVGIEIVEDIKTAYTNGKDIFISETFIKRLSMNELKFILLHELLHIILNHVSRGKDLDQKRYNIACDIISNDILKFYFYPHESLNAVFGEPYSINGYHMNVEEVYQTLPENIRSSALDSHDAWSLISKSVFSECQNIINKIIDEAGMKGYGISNSYLGRRIKQLQHSNNRNKWIYLLEKYLTQELFDYTFTRTDYRYQDILLPSFMESDKGLKNIWFLLDVSGSVDEHLLSAMFGEIARIISHYKSVACDVSFFSNKTTKPIRFKSKKELLETTEHIKTTIGTDIIQIFTSLEEYYPYDKPKLMIIFTDGYARMPLREHNPETDVLWITSSNDFKPFFGKVITIDL